MAYYLEVPLDEQNTILVDVTARVEGVVPAGRGDVIDRMNQTLGDALEKLRPFTTSIVRRLSSLPEAPDKTSVEFGVSLTGKSGVILAETAMEGHVKITLEWQKKPQPKADARE